MPELPEVETIARGLAKRVTGDVIDSVWLGEKPEPLKSPAGEIAATVQHSRIVAVRRMGKHIVFDLRRVERGAQPAGAGHGVSAKVRRPKSGAAEGLLSSRASSAQRVMADRGVRPNQPSSDAQFIVHLGMTGRLQVLEPAAEILKHTHAILKLSSGRELRFVDPRRLGRLSVSTDFDPGGIEPLGADPDRFLELFRGRKTPIKSALLNQKLLRGVGNIYADESLFRAGIRPRRRASAIPRERFALLLSSVQEVLKEAIALGGSSVSDYVGADGEPGFFQLKHRVYGREGKPCLVCKTPIQRIVIAGRSSHYCPKCQK